MVRGTGAVMLTCDRAHISRGAFTVGPLSASADCGAVTVVVGPNASGKSTLLGMLAGTLEPIGGTIRCGRCEIKSMSMADRASSVVALPQRPSTSAPISVGRLVSLGQLRTGGDPARCEAAMEDLGLSDVSDRPISTLSVGQAQRAHLARVLAQASESAVLILDEPTAPLDHQWASRIWALLKRHVSRGGTVVVAVHDLSIAAAQADAAWLIEAGDLRAAGPAGDVLEPSRLAEVFGTPFEWASRRDGSQWLVPSAADAAPESPR